MINDPYILQAEFTVPLVKGKGNAYMTKQISNKDATLHVTI